MMIIYLFGKINFLPNTVAVQCESIRNIYGNSFGFGLDSPYCDNFIVDDFLNQLSLLPKYHLYLNHTVWLLGSQITIMDRESLVLMFKLVGVICEKINVVQSN